MCDNRTLLERHKPQMFLFCNLYVLLFHSLTLSCITIEGHSLRGKVTHLFISIHFQLCLHNKANKAVVFGCFLGNKALSLATFQSSSQVCEKLSTFYLLLSSFNDAIVKAFWLVSRQFLHFLTLFSLIN